MEFIEVMMEDHKMLIAIYEIVYIREQPDATASISLKGHNMSLHVQTLYDDIINQLNQSNYRLMPYIYFKYVNLNSTSVGNQASRLIFDNIVYNQLNTGNQGLY